jgi:hypothetical protein
MGKLSLQKLSGLLRCISLDVSRKARLTMAALLVVAVIGGFTISYLRWVLPQEEEPVFMGQKPKRSNILVGRTLIEAANAVSVKCGVPAPEPNADPNEYAATLNRPRPQQETPDP